MTSKFVLKDTKLRVYLSAYNEGTHPVPNEINIADGNGDDITLSIEQAERLYQMLGDALKSIKENEERNARSKPLTSPSFSEWFERILDLVSRYHHGDSTLSKEEYKEARDFYEDVSNRWS